jgi:hypothetical protein
VTTMRVCFMGRFLPCRALDLVRLNVANEPREMGL